MAPRTCRPSGDQWEIVSRARRPAAIRATALEEAEIAIERPKSPRCPRSPVPVDAATAPKVLRLVDALEDLDDVQDVYANFDISDEVLAEVG